LLDPLIAPMPDLRAVWTVLKTERYKIGSAYKCTERHGEQGRKRPWKKGLSPAARERIAGAQRERWAKFKVKNRK
jgi:hypothetical protein